MSERGVNGPKLGRTQRQHVITKLLASSRVTSQEQLVELLSAEGVNSTQATVSRDLVDLGAIKIRTGDGESAYAIPELPHDQRAPDDHLRRVFGDWVVEVAATDTLVVLRTPPGSAHVVGSALDRADLPEVAGTVAGDDTLFIVVCDPDRPATGPAGALADRLRELAGLTPSRPWSRAARRGDQDGTARFLRGAAEEGAGHDPARPSDPDQER